MGLIYDSITLALHAEICSQFDIDPDASLEFVREYCDARRLCGQRHLVQVEAAIRVNPFSNASTRVRIDTHASDWFDTLCADMGCKDLVSLPSGRSIRTMSKFELASARDIVPVFADPAVEKIAGLYNQPPSDYKPVAAPHEAYSPLHDQGVRARVHEKYDGLARQVGSMISTATDFAAVRSLVRNGAFGETASAYFVALAAGSEVTRAQIAKCSEVATAKIKLCILEQRSAITQYAELRARLNRPASVAPVRSHYDDGFSDEEEYEEEYVPVASGVSDQERHHLAGEADFLTAQLNKAFTASHALRAHTTALMGRSARYHSRRRVPDEDDWEIPPGNRARPRRHKRQKWDGYSEDEDEDDARYPANQSHAVNPAWPAGRHRRARSQVPYETQIASPISSSPSAPAATMDVKVIAESKVETALKLVPVKEAELQVGTHMRLTPQHGLHDTREKMPSLSKTETVSEAVVTPMVQEAVQKVMHKAVQILQQDNSSVPVASAPDERAGMPVPEDLIGVHSASDPFVDHKIGKQMDAYTCCMAQLEDGAACTPTAGKYTVLDLSKYQGASTSIAQMTTDITPALNDDIINGSVSLLSVDSHPEVIFIVS